MIIDNNAIFSGAVSAAGVISGQTVTGASTTVTSTNVYDLQVARDVAKGQSLVIPIEVLAAAVGGTSISFQLVEADDAAISVNVTVLSATGPIPIANLGIGSRFALEVGRTDPFPNRRYLAVQYVLTGTFTAGSYFAALQNNNGISDVPEYYASGFQVL